MSTAEITSTAPREECVLVVAPVGCDGPMVVQTLLAAGIEAERSASIVDLSSHLSRCAAAILTIEALDGAAGGPLMSALHRQPPWSDIPIIVLASPSNPHATDAKMRIFGNLTIVQRPVLKSHLISVVQSALRARRRQYEVRDLLQSTQVQKSEIEILNEQLRRAMTETHHRVKNNLQIIAAMVDMQTIQHEVSVPAGELRRVAGHIRTLATVHDILTANMKAAGQSDSMSAKVMLDKLLEQLSSISQEGSFTSEIADAQISVRQGTALSLITNELVNNAIKHGRGKINIVFKADVSKALLVIIDNGDGFPPGFDPSSAAHTGLELVLTLSQCDLRGEISFSSTGDAGAKVELTFPLSTENEPGVAPTNER